MSVGLRSKLEISRRRWLILPIAITARELDGNGLLAFEAAERGWGVVIGGKRLRSDTSDLPRGFVIQKQLKPGKSILDISASRASGHKVGAWCEEGLIYPNAASFARLKFEREGFALLDMYFAWGRHLADDLVNELGCDRERVRITGNPRFDLYRPELRVVFADRAEAIRRRYGPFILVNTKFSQYNGLMPSRRPPSERDVEHQRRVKFHQAGFEKFVELIQALSRRFPGHTIVVRPHPQEQHETWRVKTAALPNATVVFDGNVAEWLLAADVCIHHNCTTGVEAYLLGRTAISYRPVSDPRLDLFLPNALSHEAFTLEAVLTLVAGALDGRGPSDSDEDRRRAGTARDFIANIDGTSACERILDDLDAIDTPEFSWSVSPPGRIETTLRAFCRPLRRRWAGAAAPAGVRYDTQKFDRTHLARLPAVLEAARRATGRFADVQVVSLRGDLVCVF
jgi:surface carbohydrate biosynthesis protein